MAKAKVYKCRKCSKVLPVPREPRGIELSTQEGEAKTESVYVRCEACGTAQIIQVERK